MPFSSTRPAAVSSMRRRCCARFARAGSPVQPSTCSPSSHRATAMPCSSSSNRTSSSHRTSRGRRTKRCRFWSISSRRISMPGPKDVPATASPELLRPLLDAAIESAQPRHCLPGHLPPLPPGRTFVIGAGKASAAMARALEDHWEGPLSGLVITRYGHGVNCRHIEILEAGHPLPDEAGLRATQRLLHSLKGLTDQDLVLALISGGGSALLVSPLPGLTLSDEQAVHQALLHCGAPIAEINCVRRHLSDVKGGRLAAACHPARV